MRLLVDRVRRIGAITIARTAYALIGYAPSWQRYIYQRISWTKPSGARLDLLWRYRQDWDGVNGWTGMKLNDLIRIQLRPASGPPLIWVETMR